MTESRAKAIADAIESFVKAVVEDANADNDSMCGFGGFTAKQRLVEALVGEDDGEENPED